MSQIYQPNYQKLVHNAFENGLDSEAIIGYHGTSLDILKRILITSKQPGTQDESEGSAIHKCTRKGDIFLFPIKDRSYVSGFRGIYDDKQAFDEAKSYARDIATEHNFASQLDLELYSRDLGLRYNGEPLDVLFFIQGHIFDEDQERMLDFLHSKGLTDEKITKLIAECKERKGVVLGYSKKVLDNGSPLPGNDGFDIRVQNVGIESIVGIEPIDQESYDFLDSLSEDF